ncbi:MAG: peptidoglycan DD-metalloendopeptidase family protein [Bacteroidia bacterium]
MFQLLLVLSAGFVFHGCRDEHTRTQAQEIPPLPAPTLRRISNEQYGIDVQRRQVIQGRLATDEYVRDVLQRYQVDAATVDALARASEPVFDVRRMRAGNAYTILKSPDRPVDFFIYEITDAEYVVFDLRDSVRVYEGHKKVMTQEVSAAGRIDNSLFESIVAAGLDPRLGQSLEEVFAWTLDFTHLEKGDHFKVIYEEHFVEEIPIGAGAIVAALIYHRGDTYYAFRFQHDSTDTYFDEKGLSLKRELLKVPFDPSRQGSDVTPSRSTGTGTDFFAPKGTPVVALGDGVVTRVRLRSGHESYLSIRHNGFYTTQYLHLSEIDPQIAPGRRVRQGEVIGAVGRPGKSDYHVRLRYWKDDRPVSPSKVRMPASVPLPAERRKAFEQSVRGYTARLAQIEEQPALVMSH